MMRHVAHLGPEKFTALYTKNQSALRLARQAASTITARCAFTTDDLHYSPPTQTKVIGSRQQGGRERGGEGGGVA